MNLSSFRVRTDKLRTWLRKLSLFNLYMTFYGGRTVWVRECFVFVCRAYLNILKIESPVLLDHKRISMNRNMRISGCLAVGPRLEEVSHTVALDRHRWEAAVISLVHGSLVPVIVTMVNARPCAPVSRRPPQSSSLDQGPHFL